MKNKFLFFLLLVFSSCTPTQESKGEKVQESQAISTSPMHEKTSNSNSATIMNEKELENHLRLLASEHRQDRSTAVSWLLKHKEVARPKMIDILNESPHALMAKDAAYILGEIGDVQDVAQLLSLAEKDNDLGWKCAQALGQHQSEEANQALLSMLQNEKVQIVSAAVMALGARGETSRPQLEKLLVHPSPTIRYKALNALEIIGVEASIGILKEAAKVEKEEMVQKKIKELIK